MLLRFLLEQNIKIQKEKILQAQELMKQIKLIKKEWKLTRCHQHLEEILFRNPKVNCQVLECTNHLKNLEKEFQHLQFQEKPKIKNQKMFQVQALTIAKIQSIKIKVHHIEWVKVIEELLSISHLRRCQVLVITKEKTKYLEIVVHLIQWLLKSSKNLKITFLDLEATIPILITLKRNLQHIRWQKVADKILFLGKLPCLQDQVIMTTSKKLLGLTVRK